MPIAEPFVTLGTGNGFPICLNQVDVLSNDVVTGLPIQLWTTLSGYNNNSSGLPSSESIAESHRLAMLYFWNSYELNAEANIDGIASSINVNSETNVVPTANAPLTPKSRICLFNSTLDNTDEPSSGLVTVVNIDIQPIAMYKGSDFIGYGIGVGYAHANDNGTTESLAKFASFTVEQDYENVGYELINTALTTISYGGETLHIVGQTKSYDSSGSGGLISNASTLNASDGSNYTSVNISLLTSYTYQEAPSLPATFPILLADEDTGGSEVNLDGLPSTFPILLSDTE